MKSKILALVLSVAIFANSFAMPAFVMAQEVTESTPEAQTQTQSVEETPIASTEPESTIVPDATPQSTPESTPTPLPTIPPLNSADYDSYKEAKNILDNEREAREDEWEEHEEDKTWIAQHGGNEEYFVSGQWAKDEEAKRLADEEAKKLQESQQQAQQQQLLPAEEHSVLLEEQPVPVSCEPNLSNDPSLALATQASTQDSQNSAIAQNSDNTNISTNNCAVLGTSDSAAGISGNNNSSGNDGAVDLGTGNAQAAGQQQNTANTNLANTGGTSGFTSSISNDSLAQDGTAENLNTGEDSENLAQTTNTNNLTVDNNNTVLADNQLNVEGVSGANTVTNNDGSVTLTTGDIELIANMLNILNLNVTGEDFLHLIVNIFGQLNGTLDLDDIASYLGYADDDALEIIAQNSSTGEDSTNTATSVNENNTNVTNNNNAVVNNDLDVTAVSGANNVSGNDGTANVITGRIQVLANVLNFINTNMTGDKWKFIMINIFGSLNGNIILPGTNDFLNNSNGAIASNTTPGEDSSNNQTSSSSDQTSVNNTNDVVLNNSVNASGDSGNNAQNGNDDEGHAISTGGTDISSQILNFLNMNLTGNNFVFLIVNVFGKWMGQIVGFGDNGAIVGPGSGTFAALAVGGSGAVTASNGNTGEGSVNNSNASLTNTTNVTNNNNATVNNNINVTGISGQNGVNGNDGVTSLTTGWVEIDANLLNIINTNITGNSWMVVFLNIFGDFMGNLFFGRENVPQPTNYAIGGSESVTSGTVTQSQNQQQTNAVTNANQVQGLATSSKTAKSQANSSSLDTFGYGSNPEVYQGYYNEQENNTETPSMPVGSGLLMKITLFLYSIYKQVRGIVEPVFAQVVSINLLS